MECPTLFHTVHQMLQDHAQFLVSAHLPNGMLHIGIMFRTPTQNHKCTLSIPSEHIELHNNNHKSNMETTIRRSHRMKNSLFSQNLLQVWQSLFQDSSQADPNSFPVQQALNLLNINNYIELFPTPQLLLYHRFCFPCRNFDQIENSHQSFYQKMISRPARCMRW